MPLSAAFFLRHTQMKRNSNTMKSTKKSLFAVALVATLPMAAFADDDGSWSGAGELGFAAARGNARSENLNAKFSLKKEDDTWKDNFYLNAYRSKGEVNSTTVENGQTVNLSSYNLTSNRVETGASVGYKLDERSYIVGALRYENDDFSPFNYQSVASIGYGYTVLKNATDELSAEIGPGYKSYKPVDSVTVVDGQPVRTSFDSQSEIVARSLIAYKHSFTENTSFVNTFLVEAGSDNTFLQNDAGLAVSISKAFALKIGYELRHNSDVAAGIKQNDQLMTTNLVYNFGH
jgi:putative salt-induced outer membrane protein